LICIKARAGVPPFACAENSGAMPYDTNVELPPAIRRALPEHAQDIFRAAFNHAYAAHFGEARREEAAHRIAWAAVKRSYMKVGGRWVSRAVLGIAPS
jgi:cation transport regulator